MEGLFAPETLHTTTQSGPGNRAKQWAVAIAGRLGRVFTDPFTSDPTAIAALSPSERDLQKRTALLRLFTFSMVLVILLLLLPCLLLPGAFANPGLEPLRNAAAVELTVCLLTLLTQQFAGTTIAGVFFALGGLAAVSGYVVTALHLSHSQAHGQLDQLGLVAYACLVIVIFSAGLTLPTRIFWPVTALLVMATILSVVLFLPINAALRLDAAVLLATLQLVVAVMSWAWARSTTISMEVAIRAITREREMVALKDQFIIVANHELRTPIMALYGNIELIQMMGPRLDEEQREKMITRAIAAGDIVMDLLSSVLDTSAVSSRAPQLEIEPVLLAPLVSAIVDTFDPRQVGEPGLENVTFESRPVTIEVAPDLHVLADEGRLRQVLLNLLSNALKYSAPESPIQVFTRPASTVRLPKYLPHSGHVVKSADMVVVSVRDFGLGVPPRDADKLFNRFVRLERDIAGTVRGTGVGLYLCRILVEAMGGVIWVESSGVPGEGSVFSFTIPLAPILPKLTAEREHMAQTSQTTD
jgi:signal transduction histidine kinase